MIERCQFRVCPTGAHIDHQHGYVTGFLIDKGIEVDYQFSDSPILIIKSVLFNDELCLNLDDDISLDGTWKDHFIATIIELRKEHAIKNGILAVIKSDLDFFGGLASSSATIISFAKAILKANNIIFTNEKIIDLVINVERNQLNLNVGLLDPSIQVLTNPTSLLLLDTSNREYHNIKLEKDWFEILIVHVGKNRVLATSGYNDRVSECVAAVKDIKEHSSFKAGMRLRDIPVNIFNQNKDCISKTGLKRATHYYEETNRVMNSLFYWKSKNPKQLGKIISQSCLSSIKNYEVSTDQMAFIYKLSNEIAGIYGGRILGGGFNGNYFILINPAQKEKIVMELTRQFTDQYPTSKEQFKIIPCKIEGV